MANGVMSILLQIWNLNGRKPRTTYELLSFMHVLSVPGKASIEVTKASVVSLKFLRVNKGKKKKQENVQGTSTTTEQRKPVSECRI